MKLCTGVKKYSVTLGLSLLLLGLGQNNASALNLPDVPLSVFSNVEHNVLLTFDDSGSMTSGDAPDGLTSTVRHYCSSTINGMAYNPAITYTPPPVRISPGNSLTAPDSLPASNNFLAVPVNGFITGSATVNLSNAGSVTTATHQLGYRPVRDFTANSDALAGNTYTTCAIAAGFVAAFYFIYDPALAGVSPHPTEGAAGTCPAVAVTTNQYCYRRVQHNNPAALGVGSNPVTGAWSATQQTNFANWYSYYRTRNLAAKSAAGRAFQGLPNNVRIAGQHLNNTGTTGTGTTSAGASTAAGIRFTNTTSTTTTNVMKRFCDDPASTDSLCKDATTARTDFFTRLYNAPAANMTPLRAAMQRAGNSFGSTNTGQFSPYRDVPGDPVSAANPELGCRKNFHILLTDGYWNSDTATVTNTDNTARTLGDGTTAYAPIAPYSDAWTGTLADHAFYYWAEDLRTDLDNNVKASERDATGTTAQRYWNPKNNPATWQHMQTFTIGMGISGTRNSANYLDPALPASAGDWDELLSGATSWPDPISNTLGQRIDDLWHAAINSRGDYYSAKDPSALVNAFNQIIGQIGAITGSAAGLGASGGNTTGGGTSIFQVAYDTGTWAGRLLSRPVDATGALQAVAWEAGTGLTGGSGAPGLNKLTYNNRNIFTYNPTNAAGNRGARFQWTDLSAAQKAALNTDSLGATDTNGSARLDYLRGASANEGAGLGFRARTCYSPATVTTATPSAIPCDSDVGKLGDIINSNPTYVGKPIFDYPDTLETPTYSSFATPLAGRQPMVYVGANDGMLHGFRASDGREEMAYVPNLVYSNITTNNLSLLTSTSYSHRYYVDGTPTVGDVFTGGAWRTMLVGGLRKGGKGYYALDITNPASFTESVPNAQQLVKWEFTDPDLGFSYSQATIVKVADSTGTGTPKGRWAAVFGNGYNNTGTGRAMIYIVDIADGSLIQKIDTGVSGGGGTLANPNGMATPAVIDLNDDYIADYIYAGDLLGKMWRIDVRSPTTSDWSLAANVQPLFTAIDSLNAVQPITTKPAVGFHPSGFGGLMVYFGTGKFLENGDNAATGVQQIQSFYGIYDRGVTGRSTEPSKASPVVRADLLQQTISATVGTVGTFSTRNISNNPIAWRLDGVTASQQLGWYVNLPTSGERQVTDPLVRESRVIFTTMIPSPDACNPSGTGWLMVLNTENGGRLDETLDLNGDGAFTSADNSGLAYGAAGMQPSSGGSLSSPIVLTLPPPGLPLAGKAPCQENAMSQPAGGGDPVAIKLKCRAAGRESWRQIK